jgi:hypothetical protein
VITDSQDMQERNRLGPVAVIAGDDLGICAAGGSQTCGLLEMKRPMPVGGRRVRRLQDPAVPSRCEPEIPVGSNLSRQD